MATILILDDEQDIRDNLHTLLVRKGHRTIQASDAEQAWTLFQTEFPHLVIADFIMPGADGFAFVRQLRAHPIGITVPIIIHTAALLTQEMRDLAEACGVEIILEKPCTPKTVLEAVDKALHAPRRAMAVPAEFDRDHLHVLANQLAQKIKELQEEVSQRKQLEARLKLVSRRVLEIQESERRHLARELHDEIGQVLSAISVNLKIVKTKVDPSALPRLDESIQIVDDAVDQVRNLSLDLRPAVLDDFGLESALRWYVNRLSARTGLKIHFESQSSALELPFTIRNACFRVAQEALTNVVRHAGAREVRIELRQSDAEVLLSIQDDGKGFDVTAARGRASQGSSLGLLSMTERIELLDGKIYLDSAHGKGTTVRIHLPMANSEEADHSSRGAP